MSEELSDELIEKIRYYVIKYNSKIDAANKLELSYDVVLFYTRDIRIKSRKKDVDYYKFDQQNCYAFRHR